MKAIKRFIFYSLLIVFILSVLFYVYISHLTKNWIQDSIHHSFKRNVVISDVVYLFPDTYVLKNVMVEGIFQAEEIEVHLQGHSYLIPVQIWSSEQKGMQKFFFSLFMKGNDRNEVRISLLRIRKPFVVLDETVCGRRMPDMLGQKFLNANMRSPEANPLQRDADDPIKDIIENYRDPANDADKSAGLRARDNQGMSLYYIVEEIEVSDGMITCVLNVGDDKKSIQLDQVHMTAGPVGWPLESRQTRFNIASRLGGERQMIVSNSRFKLEGWFDAVEERLEAELMLSKDGTSSFIKADLNVQDHILRADGYMNVTNVMEHINKDLIPTTVLPEKQAIDRAISRSNIDFKGRFSFQMSLDDFKIPSISLSGDLLSPDPE
ncbi:MAG: hypothetical protein K8S27_14880 [Candidatus Omnitrophica bacterium]|nr:hypothetical protein [Candidatus Omnitrophota bacterium]